MMNASNVVVLEECVFENLQATPVESIILHFPKKGKYFDYGNFCFDEEGILKEPRKKFFSTVIESLHHLLGHGFSIVTIQERLKSLKYFVRFSNGYSSTSFETPEVIMSQMRAYYSYLFERVRSKALSINTAANYYNQIITILYDTLPFEYEEDLDQLQRIRKSLADETPTVPPTEEKYDVFMQACIASLECIHDLAVNNKPFPAYLKIGTQEYFCIPNKNEPWINCALGPRRNARFGLKFDYKSGQLLTREEIHEVLKCTDSSAERQTANKIYSYTERLFDEANEDKFHNVRVQQAQFAAKLHCMIFIAGTGMNFAQVANLPWVSDKLEVSTSHVGFKEVKARANDKIVTFHIRAQLVKYLRKYIKLRRYLLDAYCIENFERLFFEIVNGEVRPASSSGVWNYKGNFKRYFDFDSTLTTRQLRAFKSTWAIKNMGVLAASEMMQNKPATLLRHYSEATFETMAVELTQFYQYYSKEILLLENKETVPLTTGRCRSFDQPNSNDKSFFVQPDCHAPEGCLVCSNYCVEANSEQLQKLFSYLFVLQKMRRVPSVDPYSTDQKLNDIEGRIKFIMNLVAQAMKLSPEDVTRIGKEIFSEEQLTPFWQKKYEFLLDLEVI